MSPNKLTLVTPHVKQLDSCTHVRRCREVRPFHASLLARPSLRCQGARSRKDRRVGTCENHSSSPNTCRCQAVWTRARGGVGRVRPKNKWSPRPPPSTATPGLDPRHLLRHVGVRLRRWGTTLKAPSGAGIPAAERRVRRNDRARSSGSVERKNEKEEEEGRHHWAAIGQHLRQRVRFLS